MPTTPLYKSEFPNYDGELPIIDEYDDVSWKNDICPRLERTVDDATKITVWCDYVNPSLRDHLDGKRFTVLISDQINDDRFLFETDDVDKLRKFMKALEYRMSEVD